MDDDKTYVVSEPIIYEATTNLKVIRVTEFLEATESRDYVMIEDISCFQRSHPNRMLECDMLRVRNLSTLSILEFTTS